MLSTASTVHSGLLHFSAHWATLIRRVHFKGLKLVIPTFSLVKSTGWGKKKNTPLPSQGEEVGSRPVPRQASRATQAALDGAISFPEFSEQIQPRSTKNTVGEAEECGTRSPTQLQNPLNISELSRFCFWLLAVFLCLVFGCHEGTVFSCLAPPPSPF